ncbi:MAG TPA: ABC transporter substrate-binding protein [Burkholderiales bacterium]|nr:ABC transporter substrate-binding protein [Burkholderiales bacterium]
MNSARRTLLALGALAIGAPRSVVAQGRVRRIGYLHLYSIEQKPSPERAAFLAGLRELGYEPGRNLHIEYRWAEGDVARLPELAAELVRQRVELIILNGTEPVVAAKAATSTLPLVIVAAGDPVHSGFVKSYARPGGNVTGLSFISPELGAKRLELVAEILPKARSVAIVWNARDSVAEREWDQARDAALKRGLGVEPMPIRETADLARALDGLSRERPDALLVIVDARMVGFRKIIADAAVKSRIPCVAGWREYVIAGALASYAPDFRALFHRGAFYVDRILRGAKPADLPVEQPTKFELVVNLKTAAAIGVTVPNAVLLRADEVIQ